MTEEKEETKEMAVERVYRCPACRFVGTPVYLPIRGKHPNTKLKDYSDVPLCPFCLNNFLWRNGTVMAEEPTRR